MTFYESIKFTFLILALNYIHEYKQPLYATQANARIDGPSYPS